jgi:hypothetical protein
MTFGNPAAISGVERLALRSLTSDPAEVAIFCLS